MGKLDNLFGSDNIMEKVLGLDFLIFPRAYFCINTAGAEVLVQTISEMAGLHRNMTLLDICCGSGAIGLSLASKVGNVSRDFLFFFLFNLDSLFRCLGWTWRVMQWMTPGETPSTTRSPTRSSSPAPLRT